MLRAVRADKPGFRPVTFEPGFNVILADLTQKSTVKDTRNGLGKTTLIEIMHFCLGADRYEEKLGSLEDWTFHLDFTVGERPVTASRRLDDAGRVLVEADTAGWPLQPREYADHTYGYSRNDWTKLLGALFFGLPVESGGKYAPSFRGLISYFIRRGRDAYSNPFEHHRKQKTVDAQLFNAFLMDLDCQYPGQLQTLKDRLNALENLRKSVSDETVSRFFGTIGELEATRDRLEDKVERTAEQLRSFKVHPQYQAIEREANDLTRRAHELENDNIADTHLLSLYQETLQGESSPPDDKLIGLYKEAGVALPGVVLKRLEDVRTFHENLIRNRQAFLQTELERIQSAVDSRAEQITLATERRAELLAILSTHGALEEFNRLNQLHLDDIAALKDVHQRIQRLREFEEGKSRVKIETERLNQMARGDISDRSAELRHARNIFNRNSEALYNVPGKLVIDVSDTGYRFDIEIERSGSQGIECMKVFCYDLMLAELWAEQERGPKFLVHDSTIFDGVDDRQVAHALELAERLSREKGFQYVCLLNSDDIPTGRFSEGFDLRRFVRLRLTDDKPAGSLLGFRF